MSERHETKWALIRTTDSFCMHQTSCAPIWSVCRYASIERHLPTSTHLHTHTHTNASRAFYWYSQFDEWTTNKTLVNCIYLYINCCLLVAHTHFIIIIVHQTYNTTSSTTSPAFCLSIRFHVNGIPTHILYKTEKCNKILMTFSCFRRDVCKLLVESPVKFCYYLIFTYVVSVDANILRPFQFIFFSSK